MKTYLVTVKDGNGFVYDCCLTAENMAKVLSKVRVLIANLGKDITSVTID